MLQLSFVLHDLHTTPIPVTKWAELPLPERRADQAALGCQGPLLVSHLVARSPASIVYSLLGSLLQVRMERLSRRRDLAQLREGPHMVAVVVVSTAAEILVGLGHQPMHLAEPDRVQTIASRFNLGDRAAAPIDEVPHHALLFMSLLLGSGIASLQ